MNGYFPNDSSPLPHSGQVVPALQQRWITINKAALANNVRVTKHELAKSNRSTKLMAVVKANAYGHGAAETALILRDSGADWFGVTTLEEAIEIEDAGIDSTTTPILIFSPLATPEQLEYALKRDFHCTICDSSHLSLAEDAEKQLRKRAHLHLKLNTGMGRLGLDALPAMQLAQARRQGRWSGVYTHFPNASAKDIAQTRRQLREFQEFVSDSQAKQVEFELKHCANSSAALRLSESLMDMVRMGTVLYGQMPSEYVPKPHGLNNDTFNVQARVVFVRDHKPGDTIGYGSEYTARNAIRTAVIPIGFADGFGVAPTSIYSGMRGVKQLLRQSDPNQQQYVMINNQKAHVIGRVSMQMIVVDVSAHTPGVMIGDVADIPMRRLSVSALIPRRYE